MSRLRLRLHLCHGVLTIVAALLLACGQRPVSHAPPTPQPGSGQLLAGAAKLDITPLPGVPLGGHSVESGVGLSVWTRLTARAIYLEDQHGEPLVLVAADLWAIPAGLSDAVVARVREQHGLTQIGRAQLLLAGTHTHHSPGNFSDTAYYNHAASTRMGFDPELFEFLTDRIAAAIAEAAAARSPAQLRLNTSVVPRLGRNRSLAPFLRNPEADLLVAHNADLPGCTQPEDPGVPAGVDACHAVDPTLTTLRIEDLHGQPIAVAAFFAVHATAMLNATDVYNGDLFAVATAHAEAALTRARPQLAAPVVALFNGPEGDVSPNWTTQGRADTLALGTTLGAAIVDASLSDERPASPASAGAIESGFTRVSFRDHAIEGPPAAHTAHRPLAGKAVLGGAEDGRTRFHARRPEGQTVTRERRPGHGPKRPAIPPAVFALIFPGPAIPHEVPISVHRVGPLTFIGLPGEFSTVMGMRIRQAVAASNPDTAPRPIAIGLADEYLSYFTTPQEYALQHYEGGSTLWGQYAGTLIAEQLGALARGVGMEATAFASSGAGNSARVAPGFHRDFALRPGPHARRVLAKLEQSVHEQLGIETSLDLLPRLHLQASAPSWAAPSWPRVQIEVRDANGRWSPLLREGVRVDEGGTEFVMVPRDVGRQRWEWAIWWIGEVPEALTLRLHAYAHDGSEHCTQAFARDHLGAPEAVACTAHANVIIDARDGLGVVP
ncbi:Alkaline ceramidase [Enhygromyxa salina]|uniref:Neutral ceramidase n=1 Tax=Enhygromyxa salina TaxID=215803 RepID=A0A0C1ZVI4_9BACT|nr:neutral/alkaline non-lysosomal ceramidase N-terminal domain-containing protein [Enhygromyxa salina]KIG15073.1 Alkaline ceramidase [Enhygromyxa salina]